MDRGERQPQYYSITLYAWIHVYIINEKLSLLKKRVIHTPCPSSLTLMLCSRSLMIWAACSQRSGGPLMWAILSGPVPSSVRQILRFLPNFVTQDLKQARCRLQCRLFSCHCCPFNTRFLQVPDIDKNLNVLFTQNITSTNKWKMYECQQSHHRLLPCLNCILTPASFWIFLIISPLRPMTTPTECRGTGIWMENRCFRKLGWVRDSWSNF